MTILRTPTRAEPALDPGAAPYRGLASYTESDGDAALFFGRDAELDVACANLLAARLTVLYGPSGAGKSSFLRAGLIHRLRRETEAEPSELGAPGTVVLHLDEWQGDPAAELFRWASGEELGDRSLHDALAEVSNRDNLEFLVVLDEFEEYLAAEQSAGGERFGEELPRLVADREVPIRFMVSLRDDALAGLDRFKGRIPELFDNYLRLDRLDRESAREAIEGPITRYNATAAEPMGVETGLVDRVLEELAVEDVGLGRPGVRTQASAPEDTRIEPAHLQLVMTRLWDAETAAGSTTLRVSTLEELGGAATIVRTHVQSTMDSLPREDQRLAARVVHYLVTPSGAKIRHTPSDLAAYADRPVPQVRALVERLSAADRRVLRPVPPPRGSGDDAGYEVFHDVLAGALLDWRARFETRRLEVRSRRLLAALVAVSAIAVGLAVYLLNPAFVRRLELDTVDARFDVRGAETPPRSITLVAVDEPTLRRLGDDGRLPRALHGRLINRIYAGRPRAIAEDIVFDLPGLSPADDRALIAALRRAKDRLVLATPLGFTVETFRTPSGRQKTVIRPGPVFGRPAFWDRTGITPGWSGIPRDPGKVVRRIDYRITPDPRAPPLPTLATKTVALAQGEPVRLASAERRASAGQSRQTTWIDYHGEPGTFERVSARHVLSGRVPPAAFRDKVVVVGVITPGVDEHRTAVSEEPRMSGVEVQANAISTLLRGAPLRDVPRIVDVLLIVLLGLVPLLAGTLRSRAARVALVAGAAVAFVAAAQLLFAGGRIVAVVVPLATLALAALGISLSLALARGGSLRRRGSQRDSSSDRTLTRHLRRDRSSVNRSQGLS
jgi:CHASE2 domain-containing sensor protein